MGAVELFFASFVIIFALANPFAMSVFYVGMTPGWDTKTRNAVALRATIIAAGIALGCVLIGQAILNFFGVTIPALQAAGGLIFMQMGFGMLNESPSGEKKGDSVDLSDEARHSMAITPLAIPFLVGPGLIAVLLSVAAKITEVDAAVAQIIAGVPSDTLIVIFADHGMHQVYEEERQGNHGHLVERDMFIPIFIITK